MVYITAYLAMHLDTTLLYLKPYCHLVYCQPYRSLQQFSWNSIPVFVEPILYKSLYHQLASATFKRKLM